MKKKDYAIRIAPAMPVSYLSLASEEDDGQPATGPARTSDANMALRFSKFQDAIAEQRAQVKRWPTMQFMVDVIDQAAGGAS